MPGDGLQQGVVAGRRPFGQALELLFQGGDLSVVVPDHGQVVLQRQLAYRIGFGGQELGFPGIAIGPGLAERGPVMGQLMGLDASQQFSCGSRHSRAVGARARAGVVGRPDRRRPAG